MSVHENLVLISYLVFYYYFATELLSVSALWALN
jgi:hypothetical protein